MNSKASAGNRPDRQICAIVAYVVKSIFTEGVDETARLRMRRKVHRSVRGEPAFHTQMARDLGNVPFVARRCQVNLPAVLLRLLDQRQYASIIGQMSHIDCSIFSEVGLESRLAVRELDQKVCDT